MKTKLAIILLALIGTMTYAQPSIEYMVHIRTDGWNQGWVQNGMIAGRAELRPAREVILNFGDGSPLIVQENGDVKDDSKRIEAIKIRLKNAPNASVKYRIHQQSFGWSKWYKNGETAGITGQSKRLEAIQIELENLPGYTIKYRTRIESKNDLDRSLGQALQDGDIPTRWMNWINEGQVAGSTGEKRRMSHIMIALVENGLPKTNSSKENIEALSDDSSGQGMEFEYYIIQEGDWLSTISSSKLGSSDKYKEIYELNKGIISNPDLIFPGQKIKIPKK